MSEFFLSPIQSLYSLSFYKKVLRYPLRCGFLFLLYLSLLFSIWASLLFYRRSLPSIDEFVTWMGANLPQINLTQQGLELEKKEAVLLTHPRFGPLIYIDPTIDSPNQEQMGQAPILLTHTKAVYHNANTGEIRMQSLVPNLTAKGWKPAVITGKKVLMVWKRMRPLIAIFFFGIVFAATFVWKLLAALGYSLVSLVLNLLRKNRLSYKQLINATIFALAPPSVLQWISWQFPVLQLATHFFIIFPVTVLYIGIAILATQEKEPA